MSDEVLHDRPADAPPSGSLADALSGVPDATEPLPEGVLVPFAEHPVLDHGEQRYDCPGCATAWVGRGIRRASAASFCPACDFPLFLSTPPTPPPARPTDEAQRRLPGVDGRDQLGATGCPACGEPNPPDPDADCLRCGAALTPPPPPQVVREVVREVVTETVVVKERSIAWMVASAVLGLVVLTLAVVLWQVG